MAKMHLPLLVTPTLLNAVNAQFTLLLKVSKASVHLDAILGRPTFSTEAPNYSRFLVKLYYPTFFSLFQLSANSVTEKRRKNVIELSWETQVKRTAAEPPSRLPRPTFAVTRHLSSLQSRICRLKTLPRGLMLSCAEKTKRRFSPP